MTKRIISIMTVFAMTMSFTAFGMSDDYDGGPYNTKIELQGYIASRTETDLLIDVTVPGEFAWYADDSTWNGDRNIFEIECGDFYITNNSKRLNLNVEVIGYELRDPASAENTILEHKINLNLTGKLAMDNSGKEVYGQDLFKLSGNEPRYGMSSQVLASLNGDGVVGDSSWKIGFSGEYGDAVLPETSQYGEYNLEIEFTAYSFSN